MRSPFDHESQIHIIESGHDGGKFSAVIPAWVPHGAWTVDAYCEEVDVFCPPRESLLKLAAAHAADAASDGASGPADGADVA